MIAYPLTALATLAMIVTYLWAGILVGKARGTFKVKAPATDGPDGFNRVFRAHMNTLEQMVAMLPALWLFALTIGDRWAALLGVVWVIGRVLYTLGYAAAAEKRETGFMISFIALAVAVLGSLIALVLPMVR